MHLGGATDLGARGIDGEDECLQKGYGLDRAPKEENHALG